MGYGHHLQSRPSGRTGRPRTATSLTLLATVALAAGVQAPAASAAPILPDLVSDAPGQSIPPETYTDSQGTRLLVRFDGFVHNAGQGQLELRASNRSGDTMQTVVQRVRDSAGGTTDMTRSPIPTVKYESADGHNHWHLKNAVRYSLYNNAKTALVAPSMKVGFCLIDGEPVDAHAPPQPFYSPTDNQFCRREQPAATDVYMGISPGWRDVYGRELPFQWIDISDVAPGSYWLRADADPDDVVIEANEANGGAYGAFPTVVNGYNATPVSVGGTIPASGATTITLASQRFDDDWAGSPGAVQYKIVTAPAKGTLDKAVGQWFTGTTVRYTPRSGQSGADSFTFAARDGTSAYPRTPRTAAVTLTIKSGGILCGLFGCRSAAASAQSSSLAISGAPQQSYAGTATPLQATSSDSSSRNVRWSVNGIEGGDGSVGTISTDGLYEAPATPPAGDEVVIAAVADDGATSTQRMRIVEPPAPRPAPGYASGTHGLPAAICKLLKLTPVPRGSERGP